MYNRLPFVLIVTAVILNNTLSYSAFTHRGRKSDANGNIFNVLLGLYKLNPLSGSQVYKTFSDHVLLHRHDKNRGDMNFDSNESVQNKVKTNLNEIEKIIHVTGKKPAQTIEKPEYEIDDLDAETFGVDINLNDRISKEHFKRTFTENVDDFGDLFEHLGSNEIVNNVPVTKLLPVNTVKKSQVSNQTEAQLKHKKDILDSLDGVGVRNYFQDERGNYFQDERVMKKDFNAVEDVIIL